jgi:hypothetical protein
MPAIPDRLLQLAPADRLRLEAWLAEFEEAWEEHRLAAQVARLPALLELVKIDLERNLQPCPCPNGSRSWTNDELALNGRRRSWRSGSLRRPGGGVRIHGCSFGRGPKMGSNSSSTPRLRPSTIFLTSLEGPSVRGKGGEGGGKGTGGLVSPGRPPAPIGTLLGKVPDRTQTQRGTRAIMHIHKATLARKRFTHIDPAS